jgi:hypothetical protein
MIEHDTQHPGQHASALRQLFAEPVDLLLPRQKHEDALAGILSQVQVLCLLQHGRHETFAVNLVHPHRLHVELPSWNADDGAAPEVLAEFGGVERCRRNNEPQ